MAKTIKQIAVELNVSKQAVFKKIDNLGLRSELTKNGNQFTVDNEIETLIKQGFMDNERQPVDDNQTSTVDTLIAMLQEELKTKNKVIEEQAETIKQLSEAVASANQTAATAQALHAGTIQLQLNDETAAATSDVVVEPVVDLKENRFKRAWKAFWGV